MIASFIFMHAQGGSAFPCRILEPDSPPQRRIEVIGASVSNGFGNRGHHEGMMGASSAQDLPNPDDSDPSHAFGPFLGRSLQADTRIIACEGSGILGAALPGVPRTAELWRQSIAGQDHPRHDPSSWRPQVRLQQAAHPSHHDCLMHGHMCGCILCPRASLVKTGRSMILLPGFCRMTPLDGFLRSGSSNLPNTHAPCSFVTWAYVCLQSGLQTIAGHDRSRNDPSSSVSQFLGSYFSNLAPPCTMPMLPMGICVVAFCAQIHFEEQQAQRKAQVLCRQAQLHEEFLQKGQHNASAMPAPGRAHVYPSASRGFIHALHPSNTAHFLKAQASHIFGSCQELAALFVESLLKVLNQGRSGLNISAQECSKLLSAGMWLLQWPPHLDRSMKLLGAPCSSGAQILWL